MSERSVIRSIAKLKAIGLLRVEKRINKYGYRTSNAYHLAINNSCDKLSFNGERIALKKNKKLIKQCDNVVTLNIKETKTESQLPPEDVDVVLIFPRNLTHDEKIQAIQILSVLKNETAQRVLDELSGRVGKSEIKFPLGYLRKLTQSALNGTFTLEAGICVAESRKAAQRQHLALIASPSNFKTNTQGSADSRKCIEKMRAILIKNKNQGVDHA